jgi:hypothetical protein
MAAGRRRAIDPARPLPSALDARRSLAITDVAILDAFGFERVMRAIAERSGTATSAAALVEQMFDTQNPKPGLEAADAPHCDDFVLDGQPSFNAFPRRCPTPEGALATADPFAPGAYIPIAIVNRFDQTPADGSNCGQYRLIFAKRTPGRADRLHLIFEGVLPNPQPQGGIAACRPVAEFWASLSGMPSMDDRRAALERFFFDGIDGFPPLLDPDHFTLASGGGIRTMEDTKGTNVSARFYQFRLAKRCSGARCDLVAEPDVLENMPFGRFFDAADDTQDARDFRDAFVAGVAGLYSIDIPRRFLMAESDPVDGEFEFAYEVAFQRSASSAFRDRIDAELKRIGSTLTADDIILRAETRSCVGCHSIFGPVGDEVTFPRGIDSLEHLAARFTEPGEAGPRFSLSPAMRDVFIPHRIEILQRFLASGTPPVHSN